LRIVFFGATELGYQCCRLIATKRLAEIVGIVSVPRQFRISYAPEGVKNILYKDFNELGIEIGVPVIEVKDKLIDEKNVLETLNPDLLLVIGWYHMIPKSIRDLAPLGAVGIHASLLPKYRGGAPLVWAMINGEKETGITLFYLGDGVDDGDIISQQKFAIEENDTIREVLAKVTTASLDLIDEYIPLLANGASPRTVQNHKDATYFPQRSPTDGLIDWNWDSQKIRNFIKAQTSPYPGAFTIVNGKKVTIWDADVEDV
jgi:methionyl-tRNA formyltransferase